VQISDENVHHVRELMDDVFGPANFISLITVKKTGGQASAFLPQVADYLLWYAKDRTKAKYRQLFSQKVIGEGEGTGSRYDQVELPTGERRPMTQEEREDPSLLPEGARPYQHTSLIATEYRETTTFDFDFNGKTYHPGQNAHWATNREGMKRLTYA